MKLKLYTVWLSGPLGQHSLIKTWAPVGFSIVGPSPADLRFGGSGGVGRMYGGNGTLHVNVSSFAAAGGMLLHPCESPKGLRPPREQLDRL